MQRLGDLLHRARDQARRTRGRVLVSHSEEVAPLDPFAVIAAPNPTMFWAQPESGFVIAACGVAWEQEQPRDPARFRRSRAAWDALLRDGVIEGRGPVLLGGYSFDPERALSATWRGFDFGALMLPELGVVRRDGSCVLTLNAVVEPDTDLSATAGRLHDARARALAPASRWPSGRRSASLAMRQPVAREQWEELVGSAVAAIRRGAMEKVVLAREEFGPIVGFDTADALRFLCDEHPSTTVFAVWRDDAVFLGASPERLVRVEDGRVSTSVLAGTADRSWLQGSVRSIAHALAHSAKDRAEHEIVRRDIERQLGAVCEDIAVGAPSVVMLRDLLHLHTPVTASLRAGQSIFDVVERLHPTPAVGGTPREAALRFLREREGFDRGWYAGPVGWVGPEGGEFVVALRCALVRGDLAHTFAGCGIVADSDPAAEWAESSLKMQTAMQALYAGTTLTPFPSAP